MNTFYLSGSGSDSNNGLSEIAAFRTFGMAFYRLKAGDALYVMNGTYTQGAMLFNLNGSPNNWTKIKAYPGHTPLLKTSAGGLNIFSCSYVSVQGLYLQGNSKNITLEYALSQKDNLNNPLTSSSGIEIKAWKNAQGLGGTHSHHIIILGNTVCDFPGGGIGAMDSDYITFDRNVVCGNAFYTPYGAQGLGANTAYNFDNNTTDYRLVFTNNIVYNNQSFVPWSVAGKITEGHGIMLDTTNISKSGVAYLGKSLIANNIVYGSGSSGIQVFQAGNVDVIHNTSYQNALVLKDAGEIDVTYSANVKVSENILYATTGQNANILKYSTNVNYFDNLIYNSALFRATDGLVQPFNILGQDPLFSDRVNGDFRLSLGSPAIFSGGVKWGYEGV